MTVALHQAGLFSWSEWTATLSAEIAAAAAGADESDDPYYRRWLAALERLVVEKGVVARDDLYERQAAWDRAARATPHGRPIMIENDPDRVEALTVGGGAEQT
jgi:nitrile hydratase accessory protein